MFLLPMYVAARHIGGRPIEPRRRDGMIALSQRKPEDRRQFWPARGKAPGACSPRSCATWRFACSGLCPRTNGVARRGRFYPRARHRAGVRQLGKFTLALLKSLRIRRSAAGPAGILALACEPALPSQPLLVSLSQVYLPMAYLYGMRARMPADELTHALRREIYDRPYDSIRFVEHRNTIAPSDVYEPTSAALKAVNLVTGLFERVHTRALRERSLARSSITSSSRTRATQFIRIGPVNAVLNTLVHFFRSPNSDATVRSFAALEGYLWDGHDGTKMNGYNSTALWDTAFAAQAMLDTPVGAAPRETLQRAHAFVLNNQVLEDLPRLPALLPAPLSRRVAVFRSRAWLAHH